MAPKALIAVTSYNGVFYEDGKKTGLFVTEVLHPWEVFTANGIEVDFASETGTWGVDEHSIVPDFLQGKDLELYNDKESGFRKGLDNIKKAKDVDPSKYDIFFASAGHATLFDYPKAEGLQNIAATIWSKGGVVSAVCHGPAIFDNLKDPATGEPLIKGKTITGFTDVGEDILGVTQKMKDEGLLTVREVAEKNGATYLEPNGPWDDFTHVDGKLVTGVNPQSASSTAKKAIAALGA